MGIRGQRPMGVVRIVQLCLPLVEHLGLRHRQRPQVQARWKALIPFDVAYQDPNMSVKEIALEVWAPPGKLGVVINTPNDGPLVVRAIKASSVITDKLQVGDKLICVDDENVEAMTAIKVSKLISRKSANPTRKLSILRQVVE